MRAGSDREADQEALPQAVAQVVRPLPHSPTTPLTHELTHRPRSHPDKLTLAENQTKEEADSHFVELTKAYKACVPRPSLPLSLLQHRTLTQNLAPAASPTTSAAATTSCTATRTASRSSAPASPSRPGSSRARTRPSSLAPTPSFSASCFLSSSCVPVPPNRRRPAGRTADPPLLAPQGRWWYGTRKLTKDGVLNSTASKYFHALKEESTFPQLVDVLASSDEFAVSPKLVKLRKSPSKAAVDEYARLVSTVREGVDGKAGWEGYATWSPAKKRARVMIAAYLLRLPIKDANLLKGASHLSPRPCLLVGSCTDSRLYARREVPHRLDRPPAVLGPRLDRPCAQLALDLHLDPPPPAVPPPGRPPVVVAAPPAPARHARTRRRRQEAGRRDGAAVRRARPRPGRQDPQRPARGRQEGCARRREELARRRCRRRQI